MLDSTLGTALPVTLFSPVWLVLEVKILLLVTAEAPSLAVVVLVSLQPSHSCISLGNAVNYLAFRISLDPLFLFFGDFLPSLSVLFKALQHTVCK